MMRLIRPVAAALVLLALAPVSALAVTVVAAVNGIPVTSYDVDQRVALQSISGVTASRSSALNELIDETVQLAEAARLGAVIQNAQVDAAFASIAAQVNLSVSQFNTALLQSGVDPDSLKRRLRAQLAWQLLMQARVQQQAFIRQEDVTAAMLAAGRTNATIREYRMQQIVFVVPAGSSAAFISQRRSEAEAFRQRFGGCEGALAQAQALRGVVVIDIGRDTSRLTAAQAEAVETTAAGRTTRPEQTSRGIEVVAVCSVTEVAGNEAARVEVQTQLLIQQGEQIGQDYLAELRSRAVIQRF